MLELVFGVIFIAIAAWLFGRRGDLAVRIRIELLMLVALVLSLAAYVIAKRFAVGLGGVTNMCDEFPWGIWITFDLIGVALAAGGFVVAATVHLFHLRQFQSLLRPMVLTAFIAYMLVAAVLVLDLGRPQRFWHPLVMWQHHSVMFEITLCLSLYTIVLAVEFSPAILERVGWHRAANIIHRLALPVVLLGVLLSTLHQSSFGSLFLIVPQKLHVLWYTPILPVMFFVSAVCGGLAVLIAESFLCDAMLGQRLRAPRLDGVGRAASIVLWIYLALRLGDLVWRRAWTHLDEVPWLTALLAVELAIGVLIPAVGFRLFKSSQHPRWFGVMAALAIFGVVLNRANVSWFALIPYTGVFYIPSWMEVVTTAALVVMGVLAFVAVAGFVPVFHAAPHGEGHGAGHG